MMGRSGPYQSMDDAKAALKGRLGSYLFDNRHQCYFVGLDHGINKFDFLVALHDSRRMLEDELWREFPIRDDIFPIPPHLVPYL